MPSFAFYFKSYCTRLVQFWVLSSSQGESLMVWGGLTSSLGCLGRGHVRSSPYCRDALCPVPAMPPASHTHTHMGTWDQLRCPVLQSQCLCALGFQVVVPNGKQRVCSINQMSRKRSPCPLPAQAAFAGGHSSRPLQSPFLSGL